jgi:hypothetical protein
VPNYSRQSRPTAQPGAREMKPNRCKVLLDRLQLLAWPRGNRLPDIPGFAIERDTFVRRQTSTQTYRRVRVLKNNGTNTTLYVQYQAARPWLAPVKITIVTEARNGVSRHELENVARPFKRGRPLLTEFAIDFAPGSGVDQAYVLRHALFGKSEEKPSTEHATLWFGTRRSEKFVRAYLRSDGCFRVELEFHSGWLLRNGVLNIEDLTRLPDLLLPEHFCFFAVDWRRLAKQISRNNPSSADRTLKQCRARGKSLHGLLAHLRDNLGLRNCRRFLRPLPLNQQIRIAALDWARRWTDATESKDER